MQCVESQNAQLQCVLQVLYCTDLSAVWRSAWGIYCSINGSVKGGDGRQIWPVKGGGKLPQIHFSLNRNFWAFKNFPQLLLASQGFLKLRFDLSCATREVNFGHFHKVRACGLGITTKNNIGQVPILWHTLCWLSGRKGWRVLDTVRSAPPGIMAQKCSGFW